MAAETTDAEAQAVALGISLNSPAYSLRSSGCLRPVLESGSGRPLSVGETLRDHLASQDVRGECREEKARLERALGAKLTT